MRLAAEQPVQEACGGLGDGAEPEAAWHRQRLGAAVPNALGRRGAIHHDQPSPVLAHACILLLALAGCKTSKSAESEAHATLSSESKLSETEHVKAEGEKHEGPWRVTTYTFAGQPKDSTWTSSGSGTAAQPTSASRPAGESAPDADGRLTSITVEEHGPSDSSWQASVDGQRAAQAKVDADLEAEAQSASKMAPAGLFGGLLALWPYLLAAGGVALLYFRREAVAGLFKKVVP